MRFHIIRNESIQLVGKYQSCMVISGRLIVHAPVDIASNGAESRARSLRSDALCIHLRLLIYCTQILTLGGGSSASTSDAGRPYSDGVRDFTKWRRTDSVNTHICGHSPYIWVDSAYQNTVTPQTRRCRNLEDKTKTGGTNRHLSEQDCAANKRNRQACKTAIGS